MAVDLFGGGAQKIRGAYQKSLGRDASDDEVGGWLSGSYGGGGEDDWVNQIGQSDEAQTYLRNNPRTPPQQDWMDGQPGVNDPYTPPANQAPAPTLPLDPGQPPGTTGTLDGSGASQIRAAYQKMLGRDATDHEVSNWLAGNYGWGSGDSGISAMLQGIANSGEAQDYRARTGQPMPTLGGPQAPPTTPPPPTFQPPAPAPVAAPAAPAAAPAAPAAPAPAAPAPAAPAAPTAPAAPREDGGTVSIQPIGDMTPITAPGTPTTITDDVTRLLKERMAQLAKPEDIQSDPTYQQAMKAYQIQQLRGADRERNALAEREAASGTLTSGGFNTKVRGINERQTENEASMASGLALDRLSSREQQLLQAIALARSVGQDDIANEMEQQRLALSQELGRGDLSLRTKLGTADQALRDRLGTGDLELRSRLGLSDLELRRLLGMGQLELGRGDLALRDKLGSGQLELGRDNLGFSYADMVNRANRDAVLAAL